MTNTSSNDGETFSVFYEVYFSVSNYYVVVFKKVLKSSKIIFW